MRSTACSLVVVPPLIALFRGHRRSFVFHTAPHYGTLKWSTKVRKLSIVLCPEVTLALCVFILILGRRILLRLLQQPPFNRLLFKQLEWLKYAAIFCAHVILGYSQQASRSLFSNDQWPNDKHKHKMSSFYERKAVFCHAHPPTPS